MKDDTMLGVFVEIARRKKSAEQRYFANKSAILSAMSDLGIQRIQVGYSGAGDSGCVENVDALDVPSGTAIDLHAVNVSIMQASSRHESGNWVEHVQTREVSLHEGAQEFAYDWLQAHHPGWENNDGADGEVIFDLARDAVFVTHNAHYMDTDTTEYEL